ncbi:F0F1 ATP synthase subunit epsilon [candidate division LCP-89 bacterium B3_LCP]|uniref:ATP synthase epsilon chain n=1 Tax=candidate division LCP-89 bacterium B3_LCP TaxID=2012998 RepID=A0A532UPR5_UNCL8|nr:MAG: F0F1 ATP synthase subunit epsilon [candidate division LCP-89 bacterium B3_LCP]
MADTFQLDIVTPDGLVFSEPIEHLRAPGVEGSFGVLVGHTPFMTPLDVGEVDVTQSGKVRILATSGGFVEVNPDRTVILVQTAEFAEDIDIERAEEARKRAAERVQSKQPDTDLDRAEGALMRSINRIRVAKRI